MCFLEAGLLKDLWYIASHGLISSSHSHLLFSDMPPESKAPGEFVPPALFCGTQTLWDITNQRLPTCMLNAAKSNSCRFLSMPVSKSRRCLGQHFFFCLLSDVVYICIVSVENGNDPQSHIRKLPKCFTQSCSCHSCVLHLCKESN
jgi:hypothetical protein